MASQGLTILTRKCFICTTDTSFVCSTCDSTPYCSSACKIRDAGSHDLLCPTMRDFNANNRPSPEHVRAIVFSVHSTVPHFAWVLRKPVQPGSTRQEPFVEHLVETAGDNGQPRMVTNIGHGMFSGTTALNFRTQRVTTNRGVHYYHGNSGAYMFDTFDDGFAYGGKGSQVPTTSQMAAIGPELLIKNYNNHIVWPGSVVAIAHQPVGGIGMLVDTDLTHFRELIDHLCPSEAEVAACDALGISR